MWASFPLGAIAAVGSFRIVFGWGVGWGSLLLLLPFSSAGNTNGSTAGHGEIEIQIIESPALPPVFIVYGIPWEEISTVFFRPCFS